MPHYFFRLRHEQTPANLLGMQLHDQADAKREAFFLAETLSAGPGRQFWQRAAWSIDITDQDNVLVFRLSKGQAR